MIVKLRAISGSMPPLARSVRDSSMSLTALCCVTPFCPLQGGCHGCTLLVAALCCAACSKLLLLVLHVFELLLQGGWRRAADRAAAVQRNINGPPAAAAAAGGGLGAGWRQRGWQCSAAAGWRGWGAAGAGGQQPAATHTGECIIIAQMHGGGSRV